MHAAVFLDRDDTLIANREVTAHTEYPGDLFDASLVELLPGAAEACLQLKRRGFLLVVVSNQGAVARGRCTVAEVEACNDRMNELLFEHAGIRFDAVYFCPCHPAGSVSPFNVEHAWRKPAPGMILQAAIDLDIDLKQSWMIGDAPRDVEAALAAGIPAAHALLIGGAVRESPDEVLHGIARFPDILTAARTIA